MYAYVYINNKHEKTPNIYIYVYIYIQNSKDMPCAWPRRLKTAGAGSGAELGVGSIVGLKA